MAIENIPRVTWEAAFANQLDLAFPLDNPNQWSDPGEGSEVGEAPSGVRDVWKTRDDQFLSGDLAWIPPTDTTIHGNAATGWYGATGVAAFLRWVRDGNIFRWIPDKDTPGTFITSYWIEPFRGPPDREDTDPSFRRQRMVIRSSDGSEYPGY